MKTITCTVTYLPFHNLFCLPVLLTQKTAIVQDCPSYFTENRDASR